MTVASSVALTSVEKFSTIKQNFAGDRGGGNSPRKLTHHPDSPRWRRTLDPDCLSKIPDVFVERTRVAPSV